MSSKPKRANIKVYAYQNSDDESEDTNLDDGAGIAPPDGEMDSRVDFGVESNTIYGASKYNLGHYDHSDKNDAIIFNFSYKHNQKK
jgi:hypothetical protein